VRLALLLLVLGFLVDAQGLLALAGMMLVVLAVAWGWDHFSLRGLTYVRRLRYRRGFPGETVDCQIEVENRKVLPLTWLRISERWPLNVAPVEERFLGPSHIPEEGEFLTVVAVRGFSRLRRRFDIFFRQRGTYGLGPAVAASGDPFGLLKSEAVLRPADKVVVFPRLVPIRDLGFRSQDPFGPRRSRRRLFEDITQPMGVRDHQPGDELRRVHWPATARQGRLQARVYEPVSGLDLIVCLNAATMDPYWMGTRPALMETIVSIAASLVTNTFEQGYRVGLISNGSIAQAGRPFRIPTGRSRQHLTSLLEALAGLTPVITAPFDRFLLAQAPRLEYGSTLVVVTAVLSSGLAEALLRLRARCRRATLVSMASGVPPEIPGVEVVRVPTIMESSP
jgi:uncharacterized protein (DUF58 family)